MYYTKKLLIAHLYTAILINNCKGTFGKILFKKLPKIMKLTKGIPNYIRTSEKWLTMNNVNLHYLVDEIKS